LVSHHGLRGRGRPDRDRHRDGQRREPDHRECDDSVADQQGPAAEPLSRGLGVLVVVVLMKVRAEFALDRKWFAIVGHRVRQLRLLGLRFRESDRGGNCRGVAARPHRGGHRRRVGGFGFGGRVRPLRSDLPGRFRSRNRGGHRGRFPVEANRGSHRRRGFRLVQHHDVLHAGVFQCPPQLIDPLRIRPPQPGGGQPMVFVSQQPIGSDDGVGQGLDGVVRQIDDGLVDHVLTLRSRFDERQARDPVCDRHPQNDVHRGSPSADRPNQQMSQRSLHCDWTAVSIIWIRFAYERSVTGTATARTVAADSTSARLPALSHCRAVRTENMFASEQRTPPNMVVPRRTTFFLDVH